MRADLGEEQPAPPALADDELSALRRIFDTRHRAMVTLALLLLNDRSSAEDVAQEAFVRLHRHLRELDDPEAYLRATVVNLARSAIRRRQTVRRYLHRQRVEEAHTPDSAERVTEREAIMSMLGRLPHRQREVLVLRYYLAFSEAEIAQALGISAGSVKTHTRRGLDAAARLLGEER